MQEIKQTLKSDSLISMVANFLFGYEVITMISVLVTTKENHWVPILTKRIGS